MAAVLDGPLPRATPERVHARVFGLLDQLAVGSVALGSLLAGPLADAVGTGPQPCCWRSGRTGAA